jgi:hypothetical protein
MDEAGERDWRRAGEARVMDGACVPGFNGGEWAVFDCWGDVPRVRPMAIGMLQEGSFRFIDGHEHFARVPGWKEPRILVHVDDYREARETWAAYGSPAAVAARGGLRDIISWNPG